MVWRVGEPTNDTEVPIGAQYIRENWAYLQSVIQKCIYFDNGTGTPADDGNFQSVQFKAEVADPPINVAGGGVIYGKTVSGYFQPYFKHLTFTKADGKLLAYKLTYELENLNVTLAHNADTTVLDFTGIPNMTGYAVATRTTLSDVGGENIIDTLISPFHWVRSTAKVYHPFGSGQTTSLSSGMEKFVGVGAQSRIRNSSSSNVIVRVRYFGVMH